MYERLLKCRICRGNVSSAAAKCPHCGSFNFKPDDYLRAVAAKANAEEEARAIQVAKQDRQILLSKGAFLVEDDWDINSAINRAYFPDAAKITVRYKGSNTRHGRAYGLWDGSSMSRLTRTSNTQARIGYSCFVTMPGTHQFTLECTTTPGVYSKEKSRVTDRRTFNITINRSSKGIVAEYSMYETLFTSTPMFKYANVHVE